MPMRWKGRNKCDDGIILLSLVMTIGKETWIQYMKIHILIQGKSWKWRHLKMSMWLLIVKQHTILQISLLSCPAHCFKAVKSWLMKGRRKKRREKKQKHLNLCGVKQGAVWELNAINMPVKQEKHDYNNTWSNAICCICYGGLHRVVHSS